MLSKENNQNYLELTPACIYGHVVKENGKVSVLVPRFTSKFWGKYLLPIMKNKYIHVKLDELGSETWMMIDGKKNVQQICDFLNGKLGDKIHPAEERITLFLTELYKNKFIKFNELNKN